MELCNFINEKELEMLIASLEKKAFFPDNWIEMNDVKVIRFEDVVDILKKVTYKSQP